MAEVPDVPWSVVVHLRRVYAAAVAAADRWSEKMGETGTESLESTIVESVLLAVTPLPDQNQAGGAAAEDLYLLDRGPKWQRIRVGRERRPSSSRPLSR